MAGRARTDRAEHPSPLVARPARCAGSDSAPHSRGRRHGSVLAVHVPRRPGRSADLRHCCRARTAADYEGREAPISSTPAACRALVAGHDRRTDRALVPRELQGDGCSGRLRHAADAEPLGCLGPGLPQSRHTGGLLRRRRRSRAPASSRAIGPTGGGSVVAFGPAAAADVRVVAAAIAQVAACRIPTRTPSRWARRAEGRARR